MRGRKIKRMILAVIVSLQIFIPESLAKETTRPGASDKDSASEADKGSGLKVYQVEVPVNPAARVETLYSWNLRDADIRDVLLTFAKGSRVNIIVEPGVSGKVTVDLNRVNFDKVLKYLLEPLGLEYTRDGDFIQVFKPHFKTQIFNLDYVNAQRTGKGSLMVSSGGGGGGKGGTQGSSSTSIDNITLTDFWGTVIDALNIIVFAEKGTIERGVGGTFGKKDAEGRTLIINPQSGVIMVTGTEKKLQEVGDFLLAVQTSAKRQVMIQAKIIEVALSHNFELGIDWSYVADFPEWIKLSGTLTGGAIAAQRLVPAPSNGIFQLGVTDNKVSVLLDAMAKQGRLNILSSPQIATLNNQTAMIKVTTENVFFDITTQIDTQTKTSTQTVTSETIDVGIVLDVTPQISADGTITLNIHPSISEVTGEAVSKTGDTRPIIDRRETNAVVKVGDGQTIVMAGLMTEKKSETLQSVPCLGDIPLLGLLFRHTIQSKQKVELVVMLTPIILNDSRIDKISGYKTMELQKSQPEFHMGIPPHSQGLQGEFKSGTEEEPDKQ